jgi:hypothetical protein
LKREVETQRLETINNTEEVKRILAYDPVADRKKCKSYRIDKQRKLSFPEIQEEKRRFFCSKIKIKPEILICYIIDHINLFSSEVEMIFPQISGQSVKPHFSVSSNPSQT